MSSSDYCPNCGRLNASANTYCEGCGSTLLWVNLPPQQPVRKIPREVAALIGFLGLMFMVFGLIAMFCFCFDGISNKTPAQRQLDLFPDWRVGFALSMLCVVVGGVLRAIDRKLTE